MLMPMAEYARRRGCSPQAVEQAVAMGRITRDQTTGLIDSAVADVEWVANANPLQGHPAPVPPPKPPEPNPAPIPPKPPKPSPVPQRATEAQPGISYIDARALREVYDAERSRLALEEKQGLLVRKDEVEREAFNCFRTLRDSCFNLPARLSAQFAAESDPDAIYAEFEKALREVFQTFAESMRPQ